MMMLTEQQQKPLKTSNFVSNYRGSYILKMYPKVLTKVKQETKVVSLKIQLTKYEKFREIADEKFKGRKGPVKRAIEEAMELWMNQNKGVDFNSSKSFKDDLDIADRYR